MPETQASAGSDVLGRIVATKRLEVERLRPRAGELLRAAAGTPPPRDLVAALTGVAEVGLIAEVKRRSPGAGEIRPGLDPRAVARAYAAAGAAAVSVLTDGVYFGGSTGDLAAVRAATDLPILRKDFILDPVQVSEARAVGADAVLLIVSILDDARLSELLAAARDHALSALVEVHDAGELERALSAGARLRGINNRDLRSFATDLAVTLDLTERAPVDAVVVSESGIRSREDVERLGRHGVDAVLVGEALLRAPDRGQAAARFVGCSRATRASA